MEQDKTLGEEIRQEEQQEQDIPAVTFDEFEIPSYEEWKEAVVALLKGKPFEKSMFTKTYEGITLNPIYRMEDLEGLTHNKRLIQEWKVIYVELMLVVIYINHGQ